MMSDKPGAMQVRFGSTASLAGPVDAPLATTVLGRKTHRRFADRAVPDVLIDALCAAALSASSKSDFQQASVLEVRDPAKRAALAKPFPAMPWIGDAPRVLGVPRRRAPAGADRRTARPAAVATAGWKGFFNAAVDAALALQTCILCAEIAGLGMLPDQRDAQPGRRGRARCWACPTGCFRSPGCASAGRPAPGTSACGCRPRSPCTSTRYDDAGLAGHRPLRPRARSAQPDAAGQAACAGAVRQRRLLRLVRGQGAAGGQAEGAAFPPWLRAHGFTFD